MKKKYRFRSIIIIFIGIMLFSLTCGCSKKDKKASSPQKDYKQSNFDLFILLDSSGSMVNNDPNNFAGAAIDKLLGDIRSGNKISVIDFASDPKVIIPLTEVNDKNRNELAHILNTIEKSKKGRHWKTDIELALRKTLEEIERKKDNNLPAIILLSDGVVDPFPFSKERWGDLAAQLEREYELIRNIGAPQQQTIARRNFDEKSRTQLAPKSLHNIFKEILPKLKTNKIPLFTIAFTENAGIEHLEQMANNVKTDAVKKSYYYAPREKDLIEAIDDIINQLDKGRTTILQDKNVILPGQREKIKFSIDEWVFACYIDIKSDDNKPMDHDKIQVLLKNPSKKNVEMNKDNILMRKGINFISIRMYNPRTGKWELTIKNNSNKKIWYICDIIAISDFQIKVLKLPQKIPFGKKIVVSAFPVLKEEVINPTEKFKKFAFTANINYGKLGQKKFVLQDNGQDPDKFKDNVFSGYVRFNMISGKNTINFKFNGLTYADVNVKREKKIEVFVSDGIIISPVVVDLGEMEPDVPRVVNLNFISGLKKNVSINIPSNSHNGLKASIEPFNFSPQDEKNIEVTCLLEKDIKVPLVFHTYKEAIVPVLDKITGKEYGKVMFIFSIKSLREIYNIDWIIFGIGIFLFFVFLLYRLIPEPYGQIEESTLNRNRSYEIHEFVSWWNPMKFEITLAGGEKPQKPARRTIYLELFPEIGTLAVLTYTLFGVYITIYEDFVIFEGEEEGREYESNQKLKLEKGVTEFNFTEEKSQEIFKIILDKQKKSLRGLVWSAILSIPAFLLIALSIYMLNYIS